MKMGHPSISLQLDRSLLMVRPNLQTFFHVSLVISFFSFSPASMEFRYPRNCQYQGNLPSKQIVQSCQATSNLMFLETASSLYRSKRYSQTLVKIYFWSNSFLSVGTFFLNSARVLTFRWSVSLWNSSAVILVASQQPMRQQMQPPSGSARLTLMLSIILTMSSTSMKSSLFCFNDRNSLLSLTCYFAPLRITIVM